MNDSSSCSDLSHYNDSLLWPTIDICLSKCCWTSATTIWWYVQQQQQ
jgi:hypothetical protein